MNYITILFAERQFLYFAITSHNQITVRQYSRPNGKTAIIDHLLCNKFTRAFVQPVQITFTVANHQIVVDDHWRSQQAVLQLSIFPQFRYHYGHRPRLNDLCP